MTFHNETKK